MRPHTHLRKYLSLILSFFICSTSYSQVFVRNNATGANDGSSWANAYTNLGTALSNTNSGEIWVARGTYKPTTCNPCDEADLQLSFLIPPDVQLYGGFTGTETLRNQRDYQGNLTILSGDIGLPFDSTDNSYNVIIAENSTTATVLDGFIIEEGNADGSFGFSSGGGLLIDANPAGTANLQVRNCTFRENYGGGGGGVAIDCVLGGVSNALFRNCLFEGNTASLRVVSTGAGVFMQGNSGAQVMPRFVSCTFRDNYSGNDGGAISATPTGNSTLLAFEIDSCLFINNRAADRGAAIWYRMSSEGESRVMIKNSRFINNQAGGQGAAIYARSSFGNIANDTLLNCIFSQNRTDGSSEQNDGEGGAVFLRGSQDATRNHHIINCVFDRNYASERGGALATTSFVSGAGTCTTNVINCTFFGNTTDGEGGGIHLEGTEGENTMTIANSILWRDSTATQGNEIVNNGGAVSVSFTDIDGGIPAGLTDGGNNFNVDPEFADPENGDLHLSGCSPLIDSGNNALVPPAADPDPDGDTRIHRGTVDLGAYEIGIIFVDKTATGANTGKSWANAFTDLQDGIATAYSGDQIWVARSTYSPVSCLPCAEEDMQEAFRLKSGVEMYGGFQGTETALLQREWESNPTILSGDIGAALDSTDNSFNVVIAENASSKTILDGFIIEEGNADGSFGFSSGGGLLIDANPGGIGDIQVRNCTFRENYGGGGGGVAIDCVLGGVSKALFRNCLFEGNTASLRVVSTGAGVFMQGNSGAQVMPRFVSCTFRGNYCGNDGGALSATPTGEGTLLAFEIDSCLFINNRADDRGAAIWYRMSSEGESRVVIKNSRFINNQAGGQGAAIYARSSFGNVANDTLINCFFSDNSTDGSSTINEGEGGAVFLRGSQNATRNHQIINCVFEGNSATERGGAIATSSFVAAAGTLNANITNCTFYSNSTGGDGGAIHAEGSEGVNNTNVINSIFWKDSAGGAGDEFFSNGASFSVSYSDVGGGLPGGITDGGNNLFADPQFLDPGNGDFRISACSPVRDIGLNAAIPIDLIDLDADTNTTEQIDLDFRGESRLFGDTVDLGAYEWNEDPPELSLDITTADVSCNGLNDGKAEVIASGGVPGYAFAWSDGQTVATATNLSAGTYYLTVSDDFNCVLTDSVVISENEPLLVSVSNDTTVCAGERVMLSADATGGDGNYTFNWDNGLGEGAIQEDIPDATTVYTLTLSDGNNCTSEARVTVEVNMLPIPSIDGVLSFCTDSTTTLDAGNFENYLWSTGDTSRTLSVNQADGYSVTVIDAQGCSGTASVSVIENSSPVPQIEGSATFCPGSTTTLAGAAGFASYLWSDSTMAASLEVSTAGTYRLTVTDANGCTGTAEVSVEESEALQPNILGELSFCEGESSTLDAGTFENYLWSTGETTPTITVTTADAYSVTVNDGSGCEGSASVEVSVNANPEVEIAGSTSFCPGSTTTLEGPAGFPSYLWSDSTTTASLEVSTAGTYRLTVTDANGCTGTAEVSVEESEALQPNILGELSFCEGESSTLDAGTFENYLWSTGETTPTITVTTADAYSVTVNDGSGCEGSASVEVSVNANPEVEIAGSTSFCPGSTTTLEGPAGFPSYLWSDSTTTASLEVSTAGTYRLTVTDANGCTGTAEVSVEESEALQPNILGELSFCEGESSTLDAGTFEGYLWSTGETTPTITVTTADAYSVTVNDGSGCEGSASVEVSVNANPEAQIAGSSSFCTGSTTTLEGPAGFPSYLWSDSTTTASLEVSTAGTYRLTVTDANGCTGTAEVSVEESEALQPNILGELSFCEGESSTLDAGTFENYLWSTGETTPTITVTTADAYSVTVNDGSGCEGSASVEVSVNANPEVEIAGSTSFCPGSTTTLQGPAGFPSYLWSDSTTTASLEVSTAGTYRLTVTDANGCTGTAEVSVEESEALQPNILGELSFCEGESSTLDAGTFENYLWSTGETTPTITVTTADAYSVTVNDGSGCEGSASVEVSVNVNPEVEIAGSTSFCTGSTTTLQGAAGFASYLWSDSTTTASLEVSTAGTYRLTVTDANGCTGTAEVSVEESEALQPNILGELSFCEGESSTLDAGTFENYLWSTGETTPTITVTTADAYSVTVNDGGGCEGSASVEVSVNANPEVEIAGSTSFCTGSMTTLQGAAGFTSYLWSDSTTTASLEVSTAGTYSLTVTNADGCRGEASVTVAEAEAPDANNDFFVIGREDERSAVYDLVRNDDLPLSGKWEFRLLSGPGLGVIDAVANGLLSYRASALASGEALITYELCSTDCPDLCSQATATIAVESAIADEGIPNAITPNGDGANDTFVFDIINDNPAEDFPDNRLVIFNRWGDIVYDKRNYDNSWAGGNNSGEKLPDGTYYYILYLDIGGEVIIRGDVTVLR